LCANQKNEKAAVNEKFLRPNKAKKGGVTFRSIMLGIGAFSVGTTVFALSLPEEASKVWTSIGGEYALQQINNYMEPEAKDISLPDWPPHFGRQPRYTLVIGLEETLVHSTWTRKFGWRHAKRPGCDQFLKSLRDYEIVIFSNGSLNFTQDIIHQIADVNQVFAWRLGAEDMRPVSGTSIKAKDIAGLNRPMDRIIVLDSNTEAFHLNPENAIPISKFDDPSKKDDTELLNLIPFFQDMAFLDTDTRKVIARYPDPSKIGETYLQQKEIDEKVYSYSDP
jgi:import inner membrane translocase subunit TIM50